jgi:hypothetical protein
VIDNHHRWSKMEQISISDNEKSPEGSSRMNLFDVLYSGKRDITEENMSALLGWMLDPGQSHGWGNLFLAEFLRAIDEKRFESFIAQLPSQVSYKSKNRTWAMVVLEEPVTTGSNEQKDIDLVLYLEGNHSSPKYVLIENKIRSGSVTLGQLNAEIEGFLNGEHVIAKDDFAFVYLTLQDELAAASEFKSISENLLSAHLSWRKSNLDSVETVLETFLQKESAGEISPFSYELTWLMKSTLGFIRTGFRSRPERIKSESTGGNVYFEGTVDGIEGLKELAAQGETYYIGFNGGLEALRRSDPGFLENRRYKYDSDLDRGNKRPGNWIELTDFLKELE